MFRRVLVAFAALILATCGPAPTQPAVPVTATLSLSESNLLMGRNSTASVSAMWDVQSTKSNVTQAAQWESTDRNVVTVNGGALKAVGLGSATVTGTFGQQSAYLQVVVRRNTMIGGRIVMRQVDGRAVFGCVTVYSASVTLGGRCGSDHSGAVTQLADIGRSAVSSIWPRAIFDPGALSLKVVVSLDWGSGKSWPLAIDPTSHLELFDADTGELLERLDVPGYTSIVMATGDSLNVPLTIKAYVQ